MIFGDPYRFAILIENIQEWGNNSFNNGLFHFFINGKMFPEEISTATLDIEISALRNNALLSPNNDTNFFNKEKSYVFNDILMLLAPNLVDPNFKFPDSFKESYSYSASTPNIEDAGYYVFCIANEGKVRIIGAKKRKLTQTSSGTAAWKTIEDPLIQEAFLDKSEVDEITNSALSYYSNLSIHS